MRKSPLGLRLLGDTHNLLLLLRGALKRRLLRGALNRGNDVCGGGGLRNSVAGGGDSLLQHGTGGDGSGGICGAPKAAIAQWLRLRHRRLSVAARASHLPAAATADVDGRRRGHSPEPTKAVASSGARAAHAELRFATCAAMPSLPSWTTASLIGVISP